MFQPLGFQQTSIVTSLGRIVYDTADPQSWLENLTPLRETAPEPISRATEAGSLTDTWPTLVFLHGFGGGSSAYEWSKVYPAFVNDYRILAPDLLGWGRSEHPARDYRIDDYLTTIAEFLAQTSHGPVTVIASSLTAAFCIRLAIARPELFQSLILTTPAGLSDFGEDYRRNFFAQLVGTPVLDRLIYRLAIATEGGIRSFLETRQFANPDRIYPELVAAYLASATQPNAEYSALAFVRGDLCFDLSLMMGELTIPTAILWGEESQFTGPDLGQRLAALNPKAIKWFQRLPDIGLTPQLEAPELTIALIRHCLKLLQAPAEAAAP
ncbi:alpha/beta fold hydrolase [Trichothermofontia sp.]